MTIRQRLKVLTQQGAGQRKDPTETPGGGLAQLAGLRQSRRAPGAEKLAQVFGGKWLRPGLLLVTERRPLRSLMHPISLPEVADHPVINWTFLDTETTGLAGGTGTVVFLLGLARVEETSLVLNQYLATSFAAEKYMLEEAFRWLAPDSGLVTYNGKCFDVPLLQARACMHNLGDPLGGCRHLDLLYPVRRAYREYWPDCRLQTAEQKLLGMVRQGDLPGSEAPAAWQDLIKRGDTRRLSGILVHNRRDLISLYELLPVLNRVHLRPWEFGADVHGVARGWARQRKLLRRSDPFPNLKLPLE